MDSQQLIGKRKKKIPKNPNPLFTKWIEEELKNAQEKGFKSQLSLKKALAAIKKYPLPLANGKACRVLDHFGDKICGILDRKLQEHVALYGSAEVVPGESEPETSAATPAKQRRRKSAGQTSSTPREYMPKYKTGGYAVILTLHKFLREPGNTDHMTKTELMRAAQPLARESFTVPDPGSRYTAWSSLATLKKKGLIIQYSNPAKYKLSDAGHQLAEKIMEKESLGVLPGMERDAEEASRLDDLARAAAPRVAAPRLPAITWSDDEDGIERRNVRHPDARAFDDDIGDELGGTWTKPTSTLVEKPWQPDRPLRSVENVQGFEFCYVAEDGSEHREKDQALVNIGDEGVGFLIKCHGRDVLTCGKKNSLDETRDSRDGFMFGFLADSDAPEVATRSAMRPPERANHNRGFSLRADSPEPMDAMPLHQASSVATRPTSVRQQFSRQDSQGSTVSVASSVASSAASSVPNPDFVLEPGTFEILLCVDNQEKMSKRAQQLLPELNRNDVKYEMRKLEVGDFLWVARPKCTGFGGRDSGPTDQELVLDYIIERKRMDDLASSIIDNRFLEQKSRLRSSGLKNPIYLVENHGPMQNQRLGESALNQAIINTQMVDGFFVKRTENLRDSITYLVLMTRQLQKMYQSKRLIACRASELSSRDYHFQTYKEFSSRMRKNRPMTVKEVFVKMLVQFSGLSLEKALLIVSAYPTPKLLMDRLAQCSSEAEQVQLLQSLKGTGARGLSKPLATAVARLYTMRTPLP